MPAQTVEQPSTTDAQHRASFFRQSGWLMFANIVGGQLMWGVHFLNKSPSVSPNEYRLFTVLLAVVMCIPTIPLQMVFAHQTAGALATRRERELAGMMRLIATGTFALWMLAAFLVFLFQGPILERWQISNPAGLWITMVVVLLSLLAPMLSGVLQGQQNFLWLGWSMILNGLGRVGMAAFAVLALKGGSTSMMTGVLFGLLVAALICLWQARSVWSIPALPFDRRKLLGEVLPLMIGFAALQFMFTGDNIFVGSYFNSGTDEKLGACYGLAGTLSRALMWLVGPLVAVMFPRIVHSTARSEKSNVMGMVLIGTAIMATGGAIALTIVGPYVVKFVSTKEYVSQGAALLPWYAGAMVPLALANVLLNNLLARSCFRVVPAVCVLALAYGFGLNYALAHSHYLETALKTMGVANVILLAVCAWYTRKARLEQAREAPSA
jgi:O-antigen/teichoic acid export membrane protein